MHVHSMSSRFASKIEFQKVIEGVFKDIHNANNKLSWFPKIANHNFFLQIGHGEKILFW